MERQKLEDESKSRIPSTKLKHLLFLIKLNLSGIQQSRGVFRYKNI